MTHIEAYDSLITMFLDISHRFFSRKLPKSARVKKNGPKDILNFSCLTNFGGNTVNFFVFSVKS